MSLTSMTFLFVFLPLALVLYYLFPVSKIKEPILLIFSLLFYAFGSIKYTILFAFAVLLTVVIARCIQKCTDNNFIRKCLLWGGITLNTSLLVYYKYTDFFLSNLGKLTSKELRMENLTLPLGISFFTFKSISYLVDVYRKKVVLTENPLHDALYLSFFAQIQSGPLSRYNDMTFPNQKKIDFDLFSDGVYRFLIGFSKKILISNVLSNITTEIFQAPFENFSTSYAWLGAICYSLQLFFDFAGYSDMAIGITEMFGYRCPENFNYPYITDSVSRFWRRWHITLSEWFRDYIYIPLGGSRNKSKWRVYFNLFIVWLLTGIWHGAAWNFVVWGLGYFVVISLERIFDLPGRWKSKPGRIIYRIFSLLFINFQWVLFRSESLLSGLRYIKRMILPYNNELANMRTLFLIKDYWFFIIVAIALSTPIVPKLGSKLEKNRIVHTIYEILIALIIIGGFIWSISFVVAGQNNPFAYADF